MMRTAETAPNLGTYSPGADPARRSEMPPGMGPAEMDTIAAISTAAGAGAIGIVRLSGPDAIRLAWGGFRPLRQESLRPEETFRLLYGHVVDPETGEGVDEALLAIMRGPRSYTREDVAELHCHGGVSAQRAVLRLMVRMGARLAEPGEFTRRAFLNGRIDLAQAEAVAAIVAARSTAALRASVRQLAGGLSERVQAARSELVAVLAELEAAVDFSDEDVDEPDWEKIRESLCGVQGQLLRLLRTAFLGRVLEQGLRTAIVGRPNVGKSSLLNALLMRERAIVSEIPGTTRDTVEELTEIGGIPIYLVDTAGLRMDGGYVEQLGVQRSLAAMEQADLVLALVDLSASRDDAEVVPFSVGWERLIVVGNKADLLADDPGALDAAVAGLASLCRGASEGEGAARHQARCCVVSALTGEGVDALREMIQGVVTGGAGFDLQEPILAGERQRALIEEAASNVEAALAGVAVGREEELVSEDVRAAIQDLGRITGEDLTPDLLDEIFSRFCIGK